MVVLVNRNTATSKAARHPAAADGINSECPARWVVHCICCEEPVEPWQTAGYAFGYCAECYGVLMDPGGRS